MGIFSKISLLIWLIILLAAAIMFDWFGSREIATSFLDWTQAAVEKLEITGDHMQGIIDEVTEDNGSLEGAKDAVN